MNLISTFLETARRRADVVAVVAGDGQNSTYKDLAEKSGRLANYWRSKGIENGDRVLLAMPVGIDLYASIAALWRLGATIVFPEPALGLQGLKHAVSMTRPKAVLTSGWYAVLPFIIPALWEIPLRLHVSSSTEDFDILQEVSPDHPALISFTSGSTGLPKGIVRSHGFLAAQNACVAEMLVSENENEIDLVAFPVFVIANLGLGITSVLPNWKLTRHDQADPSAIVDWIKEQNITRALLPPSICDILSKRSYAIQLKAVFTGGGPIFPDLMKRLQDVMPHTQFMAVYGSTEAEPIAHQLIEHISPADWNSMETGSGLLAGKPVTQTKTRIIDDEIVVTGEHVNKSYLDGYGDDENKILIEDEIWHRTGDAGRFDSEGRLWLRGRWSAKAGELFPFEIEVAARSWNGVDAVALIPNTFPPKLAIEGTEPSNLKWQTQANGIGDIEIFKIKKIPLDKRHRSKIDYAKLIMMTKGK